MRSLRLERAGQDLGEHRMIVDHGDLEIVNHGDAFGLKKWCDDAMGERDLLIRIEARPLVLADALTDMCARFGRIWTDGDVEPDLVVRGDASVPGEMLEVRPPRPDGFLGPSGRPVRSIDTLVSVLEAFAAGV